MAFATGHSKAGGRKKGARNKRTLVAEPKTYPGGLDHPAAVLTSDSPTITPELRLRAAIGRAAYQHPKPIPLRLRRASRLHFAEDRRGGSPGCA